jgi:hypothetical protein
VRAYNSGMVKATPRPRTISLAREPDGRGIGVFHITNGRDSQFYTFREIPCEIGGRGFAVHRLGLGTLYHVRVGEPADCSCECLGFLRWGRCKHVSGLSALIQQGRLPARATPRSRPQVPPRTCSSA